MRPTVLETTALGAAFLAGLGVGLWESTDAITAAWAEERVFTPSMEEGTVQAHLAAWKSAVGRA